MWGQDQAGTSCQCPAIRGRRRCRLHGGRSTGPRTAEGRERFRQAVTKHGWYTQEAVARRELERAMLADLERTVVTVNGEQRVLYQAARAQTARRLSRLMTQAIR